MLTFPGYCETLLPYLECRTCTTEVPPFVPGTLQQTVFSGRVVYSLNKQSVGIVRFCCYCFHYHTHQQSDFNSAPQFGCFVQQPVALVLRYCSVSLSVDSNFHVLTAVISSNDSIIDYPCMKPTDIQVSCSPYRCPVGCALPNVQRHITWTAVLISALVKFLHYSLSFNSNFVVLFACANVNYLHTPCARLCDHAYRLLCLFSALMWRSQFIFHI